MFHSQSPICLPTYTQTLTRANITNAVIIIVLLATPYNTANVWMEQTKTLEINQIASEYLPRVVPPGLKVSRDSDRSVRRCSANQTRSVEYFGSRYIKQSQLKRNLLWPARKVGWCPRKAVLLDEVGYEDDAQEVCLWTFMKGEQILYDEKAALVLGWDQWGYGAVRERDRVQSRRGHGNRFHHWIVIY